MLVEFIAPIFSWTEAETAGKVALEFLLFPFDFLAARRENYQGSGEFMWGFTLPLLACEWLIW